MSITPGGKSFSSINAYCCVTIMNTLYCVDNSKGRVIYPKV